MLKSEFTEQAEEDVLYYSHFVTCIDNLNNAWRILQDVKLNKDHCLAGYAFRLALIEYSKPYKNCRGVGNKLYKLDKKHVPGNLHELHRRILDARDQIHAHSDLTVMDVKVHIANLECGKFVSRSQNIIHGTEEFCNIDEIIELIEKTLESMYIEVEQLEAVL